MFISSAYRKPHDLWIITFLTHTYTYHTCTCIIPLNILYQINYNTLKQRYKGQYRHQFNMRSMSHNAHEKNKCWWWVIWINSKYLTKSDALVAILDFWQDQNQHFTTNICTMFHAISNNQNWSSKCQ
jgi:hypothetical protein